MSIRKAMQWPGGQNQKSGWTGEILQQKMGALGSGNASKSLKAKGDPRGLCVHAYSNNLTKYETQIMSPFSYLSSSSKKVICSSCSSSIADIFHIKLHEKHHSFWAARRGCDPARAAVSEGKSGS